MRKVLFVLLALTLIPFGLIMAQRTVVVEGFTATWCGFCPGMALGFDDLAHEYPGEILVLEYHSSSSDIFNTSLSSERMNFYSGDVVRGYPTAIFDGIDTLIGGNTSQSLFVHYNPRYQARTQVVPPVSVELENTPAVYLTEGTLSATITNTSDGEITGNVVFSITESNIPYAWKNQTILHFVERDMPLGATGVEITLTAGADTTVTADYDTGTDWVEFTGDEGNVEFGCFVQSTEGEGKLREIYNADVIQLANPLKAEVEEEPVTISLLRNPSILNGKGNVELTINESSFINLTIYDASGREVSSLYSGELEPGNHEFEIDAEFLPQGVYFIKALGGQSLEVSKVLILH